MNVLALSSSRVADGGYLEAARGPIRELLGDGPCRVAFVPFAAVDRDYAAYADTVRRGLDGLPYTIEVVEHDNGADVLGRCNAVMVGGGNTFKLLHDLYEAGLMATIRDKVAGGAPYIGWSAGANLTGASIRTTNDMPIIEPESFRAFGFLPFQLNPHYANHNPPGFHGETRDQRLSEFVLLHPGVPVIGIPEGSWLLRRGNNLRYEGTADATRFDNVNGSVQKSSIAPGTELSALLAL
ncbi:dipeptidase PepE [Flaviaesturariibacter amylovorans]|uniref:Dipeptidase PepE n=1 Tax=Flaviaesturariibacter amylovorans TaxID=1084520 RepID=A0ABP8HGJ6_9BACT